MRFSTTVVLAGETATGLEVPDEIVTALGAGKRPPVTVTVGGHTYRSTVAPMAGSYWLPLAAEHRVAARVAAGDVVEGGGEVGEAPRVVEVPADLAAALDAEPEARRRFDALSFSNQRRHVLAVEGAKAEATRARRVASAVAALREG